MARQPAPPDPELFTPAEVASMFRIDPRTVTRRDRAGRFPPGAVIRTLGGHRRFRAEYIRSLLNGGGR